jgi:hypothetical protein
MTLATGGDFTFWGSGQVSGGDQRPETFLGGGMNSVGFYGYAGLFRNPVVGETYYRCLYVRNAAEAVYRPRLYRTLSGVSGTDVTIHFGLGTAAEGATEQTIADEHTAPSGVTFAAYDSASNALVLPDLPSYGKKSVWVKMTVTAVPNASGYVNWAPVVKGYTYDATTNYGRQTTTTTYAGLVANQQLGAKITIGSAGTKYRLLAAQVGVHGQGAAIGTQNIRGNIYADSSNYPGALKESGAAVSVAKGAAAAWKGMAMTGNVYVDGGAAHWALLHSGTTEAATYHRDASGGARVYGIADTYSDGAADPCPAGGTVDAANPCIFIQTAAVTEITSDARDWSSVVMPAPPTETTLEVLRIFRGSDARSHLDLKSADANSYSGLVRTDVLSEPGLLEFDLPDSSVHDLNDRFSENSVIEYWQAGTRRRVYLVDSYAPEWGAVSARVTCIGLLQMFAWLQCPADATAQEFTNSTVAAMVRSRFVGASTELPNRLICRLDEALWFGDSQGYSIKRGEMTYLDWLQQAAPVTGLSYGIDADYFFWINDLPDPATATVTYAMGTTAYDFKTEYSAREIFNRVTIYYTGGSATCNDAASQALYGVRQAPSVTVDNITASGDATQYGNALLSTTATPQMSITVTVPHSETTTVGAVAEVTGLGDGRTYKGYVRQITWVVGALTDEVVIGNAPLNMPAVLRSYTN